MRYPKWFARWRLRVWDRRLVVYRAEWDQASKDPDRQAAELAMDGVTADKFWERLVTKAMLKRTYWRTRKDRHGAYLVGPFKPGGPVRKLSDPGPIPRKCTCSVQSPDYPESYRRWEFGPHHGLGCALRRELSDPDGRVCTDPNCTRPHHRHRHTGDSL